MKADEVYAKLKKMIGLVSVGMKNTTSTQNPDGSVTITINFTSGSPLSFTMTPVKGDKGVGIKDAQIKEIQNGENTEYHLILIDDKDNNIDAGNIPIPSAGSNPDITNLATKSDLKTHTDNVNIHVTSAEKSKWNNKAEISDIPNLTNYATKTYVTDEIAKAATGGTVDLSGYAKTVDVNSALDTKVDKVSGKSLISDTEIVRLSKVNNYDDTAIIESINSKANTTDLTTHTSDTNIHITTAERNKWNAVDNISQALKTTQSIEYGGKSITCRNTLESRTSDMLIKGQTNKNASKIESAGEKENKISILSKNKESVDDNNYKQDKKEILLPVDGGLKSLPNNVADTIEQRNDGVYLVQRVGKVVLNGSERWDRSSWSMTNTFKFDFEIGLVAKLFDTNVTNQILCNTFEVFSRNSLDNVANREFENICASNSRSRTLSITILKTKLNNTNTTVAFKQWLSNNPVTVCYELATPVETKLDINNLDLEVYKDTTYVTTDNTIQPTLSFKVQSNIGGVIQENAKNINKLYNYKVDKVDGKGLSTNDYTTEEKTKVSKIVTNGNGTTFLANDGTYKKVNSSASAVAERKFKPVFGFDTYWGEMRDTHGNKNQVELVRIKEQIDQCEAMKVDKIICTVHIGWDETTNSLVIAENTDSLLSAISYCADKNVTIDTVKVHVHFKGSSKSEKDYVNDVIGMSTFQSKYKPMLTTICNLFKNTTVTRIIILNEMWYITNSNLGYSSFVNECLNIVKSAGYTTGLSMAGFNTNLQLSNEVIENLDTFYINVYPGISGSGKYITKLEAIEAFNQCDVDLWIVKLKKDYPNKKIVISEIGTNDYWESLACPSSWQVSGNSKTGGYAVDTYITAMMEFFINKNVEIEELWWWYDLYYEPVKETLLNYLGGDR